MAITLNKSKFRELLEAVQFDWMEELDEDTNDEPENLMNKFKGYFDGHWFDTHDSLEYEDEDEDEDDDENLFEEEE